MKIKSFITAALCALLLATTISCNRENTGDLPLPQDTLPESQGENGDTTEMPAQSPDEANSEEDSFEEETEDPEIPVCDHVFEEDVCTLCGSDITVLFKFGQSGFDFDETYHIYGTQGTLPSKLTIPATYNGKPVKYIKSHAIKDSDTLTELIIPDSFVLESTCIENCPNLSTIRLSLYSLPADYFMNRNFSMILDQPSKQNLTTVYVSPKTTKLVEGVFAGCDFLENVYLPAELKEVEAHVFNSCTSLTNIVVEEANPNFYVKNNCLIHKTDKMIVAAGMGAVIPDDGSVTGIGSGAFSALDLSKELVIPDCIRSIGGGAFAGWDSLEKLTIPFLGNNANDSDGLLGTIFGAYEYDQNAKYVPSALKEVTVTGGKVPMFAFRTCKNLTTINLEGITSIEPYAFMECPKLKTVHLGQKLQSLDNLPTGMTIIFDEENPYFSLGNDGTFYSKDGSKLILANKNTVLPTDGTLLEIGENAFAGCYTQETLVIPDSVIRIGKNAFAKNTNLRELTLPASVTDIKEGAFFGCTKLTRVYGGQNVEWIGASAFEGCTGLLTVEPMPAVKAVSTKAFFGCRNLRAVPWDENATQLKTIAESAFEGCAKISAVILPDTVSVFGKSAFKDCTSLENVVFSSNMKTIPLNSFAGCSALSNLTFKEGLQVIESSAFSKCTNLSEVILPDTLTAVGQSAFSGSGLKTLHVGSGVKEIQSASFPRDVETVTLSENNPYLYVSGGCLVDAETETLIWGNGQKFLSFERSFKAVGEGAFMGCTNLYAITLPEGCEVIGGSAFWGCTKLVEVNFPSTLKSIHKDSFYQCPVADDLDVPKNVEILK